MSLGLEMRGEVRSNISMMHPQNQHGRSRGFGFITFHSHESVANVRMHGRSVHRWLARMHVYPDPRKTTPQTHRIMHQKYMKHATYIMVTLTHSSFSSLTLATRRTLHRWTGGKSSSRDYGAKLFALFIVGSLRARPIFCATRTALLCERRS